MDINQIHIGCWYSVNGKVGRAISINTTIKNGVKLEGIHSCPADAVEPIPITENFLDNNGIFENDDFNEEGVHYRKTGSIWSVTNERCRVFDINADPECMISSSKILYISQLQQALITAGYTELASNLKVNA